MAASPRPAVADRTRWRRVTRTLRGSAGADSARRRRARCRGRSRPGRRRPPTARPSDWIDAAGHVDRVARLDEVGRHSRPGRVSDDAPDRGAVVEREAHRGRSSTTSPPTRTSIPTSPSRSMRSAGIADVAGSTPRLRPHRRRRSRIRCRAVAPRPTTSPPVAGPCSDIGGRPREHRRPAIRRARVGAVGRCRRPRPPDPRSGPRLGMRAPGWPTTTKRCAPIDDLGPPAIAELADARRRGRRSATRRQAWADVTGRATRSGAGHGRDATAGRLRSREGAARRTRCPTRRSTRIRAPDAGCGRVLGQQDLDRAGRILDDDPPPGPVEQAGGRGHDRLDGDVALGRSAAPLRSRRPAGGRDADGSAWA